MLWYCWSEEWSNTDWGQYIIRKNFIRRHNIKKGQKNRRALKTHNFTQHLSVLMPSWPALWPLLSFWWIYLKPTPSPQKHKKQDCARNLPDCSLHDKSQDICAQLCSPKQRRLQLPLRSPVTTALHDLLCWTAPLLLLPCSWAWTPTMGPWSTWMRWQCYDNTE